MWLLCELGEIENAVHILFCCLVYNDIKVVLFGKQISSIYDDFFWLERRQNISFVTELFKIPVICVKEGIMIKYSTTATVFFL